MVLTKSARTHNEVLVAHRHARAQQRGLIETFERVRRGKRVCGPQTTEAHGIARVHVQACNNTNSQMHAAMDEQAE
jgi:hypothetical protein